MPKRLRPEPTPLVPGVVLGPAFKEYLRRELLFSRGDPTVLLTDPVAASCLGRIAGLSAWLALRPRRQNAARAA